MALSKHTRTRLLYRNGKRVRAHRWIMEQYLGRPLLASEDVHHLNHNPLDNRIENLVVMERVAHSTLHALEKQRYPDVKACAQCGTRFRVSPRKRKRNSCCSLTCARRIAGSAPKKRVA